MIEKGSAQSEKNGRRKRKKIVVCTFRDNQRLRGGTFLKCVYFNTRSILRKVNELRAWIDSWKYDVAISETLLQEGCDWQLIMTGFDVASGVIESEGHESEILLCL